MGEGRKVYKVLVGKSEGKRPLERPRHRWEDGLKMDLKEKSWDLTGLGKEPVVGSCELNDQLSGSGAT
jgi:hypothetical protein